MPTSEEILSALKEHKNDPENKYASYEHSLGALIPTPALSLDDIITLLGYLQIHSSEEDNAEWYRALRFYCAALAHKQQSQFLKALFESPDISEDIQAQLLEDFFDVYLNSTHWPQGIHERKRQALRELTLSALENDLGIPQPLARFLVLANRPRSLRKYLQKAYELDALYPMLKNAVNTNKDSVKNAVLAFAKEENLLPILLKKAAAAAEKEEEKEAVNNSACAILSYPPTQNVLLSLIGSPAALRIPQVKKDIYAILTLTQKVSLLEPLLNQAITDDHTDTKDAILDFAQQHTQLASLLNQAVADRHTDTKDAILDFAEKNNQLASLLNQAVADRHTDAKDAILTLAQHSNQLASLLNQAVTDRQTNAKDAILTLAQHSNQLDILLNQAVTGNHTDTTNAILDFAEKNNQLAALLNQAVADRHTDAKDAIFTFTKNRLEDKTLSFQAGLTLLKQCNPKTLQANGAHELVKALIRSYKGHLEDRIFQNKWYDSVYTCLPDFLKRLGFSAQAKKEAADALLHHEGKTGNPFTFFALRQGRANTLREMLKASRPVRRALNH